MLNNWLNPVPSEGTSSYFNAIYHSSKDFPNLEGAKVAVITRNEAFGNLVRKKTKLLANHFNTPIVDIGSLNTNNNSSAYQVISELQDGHIIPILIDVDLASYQDFCKAMLLENKLRGTAHISNTAVNPSEDFAVDNIGYQRHLVPKHILDEIYDSSNPGLSLGTMRSQQKILEPLLREVSYIHFDLAAIRSSDCPGKFNSTAVGLHAEEACQIMRYAGEGLRLKLVTFDTSGLDTESEAAAMLVATLLWYLHEGIELRDVDHPAISDNFKQFVIEMNEVDHSLVFMQSTKSGKWWLQKEKESNDFISCAYEEYQQSINNEIPDRLLKLL